MPEPRTAIAFDEFETVERCDLCAGRQIEHLDSGLRLACCQHCGHMFFDRRPTQAAIARHYDKGGTYDDWLSKAEDRRRANLRRIEIISPYLSDGPILDVGCGIGEFLELAGERWPRVRLCGTELSQTALAAARERFGLQDLFCGQIEGAPWPDESFDLITLWQVLEHVPSPSAVVRKANRLLRDGGHLLLSVPNDSDVRTFARSAKHSLERLLGKEPGPLYPPLGSFGEVHLSLFTPKTLRYLLVQRGFRVVHTDLDRCRTPTFRRTLFFGLCRALYALLRINFYETVVVVGQKVRPGNRKPES